VDFDIVAQLPRPAINLNAIVKELLESRSIKDTIARRTGEVYDKFMLGGGGLSGLGSRGFGFGGLEIQKREPTETYPQNSNHTIE
jgi:hypothetical protein